MERKSNAEKSNGLQVAFRLTPEFKRRLEREAAKRGSTPTQLARHVVTKFLLRESA